MRIQISWLLLILSNLWCQTTFVPSTEYQQSAKAAIAMSPTLLDHLCVIHGVIQTVSLLIIQMLVLRKTEFSKLCLSQQQILIFPIVFVYICILLLQLENSTTESLKNPHLNVFTECNNWYFFCIFGLVFVCFVWGFLFVFYHLWKSQFWKRQL